MAFNKKTRSIEINLELGVHARPAAAFVKLANQFKSDITVEKDGEEVNGKSIIGLLTLEIQKGSKIDIKACGPDATSALDALESLIQNNFIFSSETHLR
jgi:phosphocarrier protein HPr